MTVDTWSWIGAFGMAIGAAILYFNWSRRTKAEEEHSSLHFFVPLIAMASYFAMAVHQGETVLSNGTAFLYARYIDWSITTPLLLFGLSLTALRRNIRRPGLVGGLIAADSYMILTGLFAGLSEGYIKWIWFTISCFAFLAVYGVLWGPLKRESARNGTDIDKEYTGNAMFLSVIWFLYPVVFLFGTPGLKMMSPVATAAAFTILDLIAKVIYGIYSMARAKSSTEREISERRISSDELITDGVAAATARV